MQEWLLLSFFFMDCLGVILRLFLSFLIFLALFENPLEIGTIVEDFASDVLWISRLFIVLFAPFLSRSFFFVLRIYLFQHHPVMLLPHGILISILISVLLPILFATFSIYCFCSFTWGFFHVKHARGKALFGNCMNNI